MSYIVNLITIAVGILIFWYVLRLVVNHEMTEAESVLWFIIALVVIILGIFPNIITWVAAKLGIWYAPSVLWMAIAIVLLLIVFRNSIVASEHENEINELSLQVALLKDENEKIKAELASAKNYGEAGNGNA